MPNLIHWLALICRRLAIGPLNSDGPKTRRKALPPHPRAGDLFDWDSLNGANPALGGDLIPFEPTSFQEEDPSPPFADEPGPVVTTEMDWLKAAHPTPMLTFLEGKASPRKFRLFACACCRVLAPQYPNFLPPLSPEYLEVAERYADGQASALDLTAAREAVTAFEQEARAHIMMAWGHHVALPIDDASAAAGVRGAASVDAARGAHEAASATVSGLVSTPWFFQLNDEDQRIQAEGYRRLAHLFREIVSPFHPLPVDPSWRTVTVQQIAQVAYDERHLPEGTLDRLRLAILADALEEAGCSDLDLLGHLRGPGPHVRGCWALDLILGTA